MLGLVTAALGGVAGFCLGEDHLALLAGLADSECGKSLTTTVVGADVPEGDGQSSRSPSASPPRPRTRSATTSPRAGRSLAPWTGARCGPSWRKREDLERAQCEFQFCPGPDRPTAAMMTCFVCCRVKRLRVMLGWLADDPELFHDSKE